VAGHLASFFGDYYDPEPQAAENPRRSNLHRIQRDHTTAAKTTVADAETSFLSSYMMEMGLFLIAVMCHTQRH